MDDDDTSVRHDGSIRHDGSMFYIAWYLIGIFILHTYIWLILMVNVGKYIIQRSVGAFDCHL